MSRFNSEFAITISPSCNLRIFKQNIYEKMPKSLNFIISCLFFFIFHLPGLLSGGARFLHDLIYFELMKLAGKEPRRNYKSSSKSLSCTYNRYPGTSFVKPVTQSSV